MNVLDRIRLFRRVAETQSFSGAAQELGVAQPTVSKAIAVLESRLGVQLFRRSTRGLSLTQAGGRLLEFGVPALDRLEDALAEVRHEPLELTGELRIASTVAFAQHVLVPTLEEFSTMYPEIRLNLRLRDGPANFVRDGIDIAIHFGRLADRTLTTMEVGSSKRAVYAAPSYLEQFGRPRTIDDLRNHRLVHFNLAHDRPRWRFRNLDGSVNDFFFEPYIQADASDVVLETVLQGLGITKAATWMMTVPERDGRLTRLLVEYCPAIQPIFVVVASARPMAAKQQAFSDFLKCRLDSHPELALVVPTKTSAWDRWSPGACHSTTLNVRRAAGGTQTSDI